MLDQFLHVITVEQYFDRWGQLAIPFLDQTLRNDRLETHREVHIQRRTAVRREEVDDAVECVIAVVGMQRAEAEVAGLGVGHGRLHGLLVTDFADQDAVGRLSHGVLQGIFPGEGIHADLALVDQRLLVLEQILDRVLDGENVSRTMGVAMIEHRCQGGRFPRSGRADDEHQTTSFHDQVGQYRGQHQRIEWRDIAGDVTYDDRDRAALPEQIDPEVPETGYPERDVHLLRFFEDLCLFRSQQFAGDLLDHRRFHDLLIDRYAIALDLDVDRCPGTDEDVRGLPLRHHMEELFEDHPDVGSGRLDEGALNRHAADH